MTGYGNESILRSTCRPTQRAERFGRNFVRRSSRTQFVEGLQDGYQQAHGRRLSRHSQCFSHVGSRPRQVKSPQALLLGCLIEAFLTVRKQHSAKIGKPHHITSFWEAISLCRKYLACMREYDCSLYLLVHPTIPRLHMYVSRAIA